MHEISVRDLAEKRGTAAVLDIRGPDEYVAGLIEGAIAVPRGRLEKLIGTMGLDIDREIVLYCESGNRSALAAATLEAMGYTNVSTLAGGFDAWHEAGLPVTASVDQAQQSLDEFADSTEEAVDYQSWTSVRSDFPITTARIACSDGVERSLAYFDHAATTHPPKTALRCYSKFLGLEYANVHRATHALARSATERFEAAYETCARFIQGELNDGCVVFTQNTTHACDLVAHVIAHLPGKVLVTDLEHHSNDLPHRNRNEIVRVGLDAQMRLDMEQLESTLKRESIKLVAVCGAANVTGWMPPIHEIARMAHEHGALICVDGAQLMAHAPVDVKPFGHPEHIDFLTAAGHKMYAPFGIGFLYGPRALLDDAPPYLPGGGTATTVGPDSAEWLPSPDRHHGGTPNVAGVIGLARVIEFLAAVGMDRVREHELKLLRHAWAGLEAIDGITMYGPDVPEERVGILPFNVAGVSDLLCSAVLGAETGIAVRNGRFCAHVHADRLLEGQGGATQVSDVRVGAVRASFGIYNNEQEVDRLVQAVRMIREHKWVGHYEVKGGDVTSASAGRCADAWMETTDP